MQLFPIHIYPFQPSVYINAHADKMGKAARGGAKTPEWEHNRNNARRVLCLLAMANEFDYSEYMRARAKGLQRWVVVVVYVLRTNLRITCAGG